LLTGGGLWSRKAKNGLNPSLREVLGKHCQKNRGQGKSGFEGKWVGHWGGGKTPSMSTDSLLVVVQKGKFWDEKRERERQRGGKLFKGGHGAQRRKVGIRRMESKESGKRGDDSRKKKKKECSKNHNLTRK